MHLLNISWLEKYKLVILITIFTLVFLAFPLFVFGIKSSFYLSLDPDIVYLTNALLYTKSAVITYADHPGTPTIISLFTFFIPLRIYTKILLHQNFIDWAFNNFALLTYVSRSLMIFVFTVGVSIQTSLIHKEYKSPVLTIIAGLLLILFAGSNFALIISPENLSFLLTSVWLVVFVKFTRHKNFSLTILMNLVAGVIFANKFTSLFILIISLLLTFTISNASVIKRIFYFLVNIIISISSFFVGILPAIIRFDYMVNWAKALFNHTGKHGTGKTTFFEFYTYFDSLSKLVIDNWLLFALITLSISILISLVLMRKFKLDNCHFIVYIVSLLGIFIFAKYPVIHYNYVNITLFIFSSIYFLSKTSLNLSKYLSMFLMLLIIFNSIGKTIDKNYVDGIASKKSVNYVLNDWTTPLWSGNLYREKLNDLGFKQP